MQAQGRPASGAGLVRTWSRGQRYCCLMVYGKRHSCHSAWRFRRRHGLGRPRWSGRLPDLQQRRRIVASRRLEGRVLEGGVSLRNGNGRFLQTRSSPSGGRFCWNAQAINRRLISCRESHGNFRFGSNSQYWCADTRIVSLPATFIIKLSNRATRTGTRTRNWSGQHRARVEVGGPDPAHWRPRGMCGDGRETAVRCWVGIQSGMSEAGVRNQVLRCSRRSSEESRLHCGSGDLTLFLRASGCGGR